MLKCIRLHGVLGERFGKEFYLDIDTIREATYALGCQIKEFKQFMLEADQKGLKFAVFTDKVDKATNVSEEGIDNYTGASVIHIVPQVVGAGGDGGFFQVIAGAVLIGLSPFLAPISPYLMSAGIGLMIGGAASLLMPTPDVEGKDPDGNKPSNGFGGAVTTVAQGNPVPVLYGEREIGGFIVSAGIYTEDAA
mgnify:CR=1 FL=1